MATVEKINIGLLNDKLTVKVSKEDYYSKFEKKLKEYSTTASLPGFRKGKVPTNLVKKMYGENIFQEEVLRSVETNLQEYLTKENPSIFAQPIALENEIKIEMANPSDYVFDFEIGLQPVFEIPDLKNSNIILHKVNIGEELINEEIEKILEKNSTEVELEIVEDTDLLNLDFRLNEADEAGNIIEEGLSLNTEGYSLKDFKLDFKPRLIGLKIDDNIALSLKDAFEAEHLEDIIKRFKFPEDKPDAENANFVLTILFATKTAKSVLDEAFFEKIYPKKEIKTLDKFKETIQANLQTRWDEGSRKQMQDQVYHFMIDNVKMDFPESFLKKTLLTSGKDKIDPEQIDEKFDKLKKELKWSLIMNKLEKDLNIEVTNESLREFAKEEIIKYYEGMGFNDTSDWIDRYVNEILRDRKTAEMHAQNFVSEKIFASLIDGITPEEKPISIEEFTEMVTNHHH